MGIEIYLISYGVLMKNKSFAQPIRTLSSSDFVNLFIKDNGRTIKYRTMEVQVYDYKQLALVFKVPTTVFRPDYNYMILIKKGQLTMQFCTEISKIQAPAVLVVSAGTVMSVRHITPDIEGTLIILEDYSLHRVFSEKDLLRMFQLPKIMLLDSLDSDHINAIGDLMLLEYQNEKPDLQVVIALVQALLHKIIKNSGVNDVLSRNHMIAMKFKELVYKNYATEKNISYYTGVLQVTQNYLNRCTQMVFNRRAKSFILEVAIMHSQLLLQDLQKGVSEVAAELNFDDFSYFSRVFRKTTGHSPSDYKRRILAEKGHDVAQLK
jgi:AraC family transcriptional activator of pobA